MLCARRGHTPQPARHRSPVAVAIGLVHTAQSVSGEPPPDPGTRPLSACVGCVMACCAARRLTSVRCTTRGFKGNDRAGVLNPVPAASVLVLRWFVTAQGVSSVGSHAEIRVSRLGLLPLVFAGHILYMVSACCAGATTRRALLMLRLHTLLRYFWAGLERTTLLRVFGFACNCMVWPLLRSSRSVRTLTHPKACLPLCGSRSGRQ